MFPRCGVAILVVVAAYLYSRILKKASPSVPPRATLPHPSFPLPSAARRINISGLLSPQEVFDTIRKTPPDQKEEIVRDFIGIKVSWSGVLLKAQNIDDGCLSLVVLVGDDSRMYPVCFEIPQSEHVGSDLLNERNIIKITGVIKTIHTDRIDLSQAQITSDRR